MITMKENWRKGHPNFIPLKVGDLLSRRMDLKGVNVFYMFAEKYKGPYGISNWLDRMG